MDAPVLLVSDIMRGGVFASLYGTMELLPNDEKRLVKGLVVNKFIGDLASFEDGVRMLEELCGVPVLGVIPYTDVRLEDEDSLTDGEMKTKESLMSGLDAIGYNAQMQTELDRLASHFRTNLNMTKLYDILDGGA